MAIHFYNTSEPLPLPNRRPLKLCLRKLFECEDVAMESLTYIFCSDKYLLEINREFLQHDDYTDIITFSLGEPKLGIRGEIYISTERVRENAAQLNTSFHVELHRVIFHGALHLCGYTDKTTNQKKRMRQKEDHYLRYYGLLN